MSEKTSLKYKIASEEYEYEQIHRLNYKTFVEEIPQHEFDPAGTLIDKFHGENTYIICLSGEQLVGMVAVRDKRPFSLDNKIENLDVYLPPGCSVCEIRLLAVESGRRNGPVLFGLSAYLAEYCLNRGYNLAVISGTVLQQKLYRHIGFIPFGPLVGTPGAEYQPMYLTLAKLMELRERSRAFAKELKNPLSNQLQVNLLPGPVGISQPVREVFAELPVSHRSDGFKQDFRETKRILCQITGAEKVEIFMGSGTLANDIVAGQLSLLPDKGIIITNGEFGDRLIDHATRFGLKFEAIKVDWGRVFRRDDIAAVINRITGVGWIWSVHCETSTGVLNDLEMLKELSAAFNIRLCMDCISSIGTVPIDLRGTYLATGVSGKGIGAFSGLSMVFYDHELFPAPLSLPRYLDIGLYAAQEGIPFTISSNLIYSLKLAVEQFSATRKMEHIKALSQWLNCELGRMGFRVIAPDGHASPAVITIALPQAVSSKDLGERLESAGFMLSFKSAYLLTRNWIQICLMGECSRGQIEPLLNILRKF